MTRGLRAVAIAGLLLAASAAPAHATITNIWGPPGELCKVSAPCTRAFHYPIPQGRTVVLDIEGQFVDLSTGLEVSGSGVSVSTDHTASSNRFIRVAVGGDATPGLHTITLHYAVELNGPDRFQILVLHGGRTLSVVPSSPSAYFNDASVTLQGQDLDNVGVIVLPAKVGTFSVGGGQVPQVVTLKESVGTATATGTGTQAVVKFHFDGGPFAEAKATVLLFDKEIGADVCETHRFLCYRGIDSTSTNETTVHVIGPNAVSAITFPFGSSVRVGSPITARIKLVRPAKAGGETVRFEVVPATSFVAGAGSGTIFRQIGVNSVIVPSGDQTKDVTLQLTELPEGCRQTCSGQFRTRRVNFTVDALPFLQSAAFTIVK
jgi:hypothetical protein